MTKRRMRSDLIQGLLAFPQPGAVKTGAKRPKFFQIIPAKIAAPTRLSRRITMPAVDRDQIWRKLRERKNI